MNVFLPDELRSFVDEQVSGQGYETGSEYIRELIRRDRDREHLRSLLLEGARSPAVTVADEGYFAALRDRVRNHIVE